MAQVEMKVVKGIVGSNQKDAVFASVPVIAVLPAAVAVRVNDRENVVFLGEELLPLILPRIRSLILADPAKYGVSVATGGGGRTKKTANTVVPDNMADLLAS